MPHKINLELEIRFSSRWHAGSGKGSFTADRLVSRDAQNRPYIPASTFKGVVRQSCEKLSRTLKFPDPVDPHASDLTRSEVFASFSQIKSPVDRLFGTKFQPGGLFFRDARPGGPAHGGCTTVRNRVARHRILNTAKDKQLFNTEYSLPGAFHTRIDGWHNELAALDPDYPPYAYCLLIAGILAVEKIGGDKSTGAGWLDGPVRFRRAEYNGSAINLEDIFEFLNPEDYTEMRGQS